MFRKLSASDLLFPKITFTDPRANKVNKVFVFGSSRSVDSGQSKPITPTGLFYPNTRQVRPVGPSKKSLCNVGSTSPAFDSMIRLAASVLNGTEVATTQVRVGESIKSLGNALSHSSNKPSNKLPSIETFFAKREENEQVFGSYSKNVQGESICNFKDDRASLISSCTVPNDESAAVDTRAADEFPLEEITSRVGETPETRETERQRSAESQLFESSEPLQIMVLPCENTFATEQIEFSTPSNDCQDRLFDRSSHFEQVYSRPDNLEANEPESRYCEEAMLALCSQMSNLRITKGNTDSSGDMPGSFYDISDPANVAEVNARKPIDGLFWDPILSSSIKDDISDLSNRFKNMGLTEQTLQPKGLLCDLGNSLSDLKYWRVIPEWDSPQCLAAFCVNCAA